MTKLTHYFCTDEDILLGMVFFPGGIICTEDQSLNVTLYLWTLVIWKKDYYGSMDMCRAQFH